MFDLNSFIIDGIKLFILAIFIFSFMSFCFKLKISIENNDSSNFSRIIWNKRWYIFIIIISLISMISVFNLEQAYRPKNILTTNTSPTIMGSNESRKIPIKNIEPINRELIYKKNKQQGEYAKKIFKDLK
jgi:hypothetical protein